MDEESSRDPKRGEGSDREDLPSEIDAMGKDKRRQVIGKTYGPTVRKQLTLYGIAVALIVLAVVGSLTIVRTIDNEEKPLEDTAPWSQAEVEQIPPRPIDFKANGPTDTVDADKIVNR